MEIYFGMNQLFSSRLIHCCYNVFCINLFHLILNHAHSKLIYESFQTSFSVLRGPGIESEHCIFESIEGHVTIHPVAPECSVNGTMVRKPLRLSQGMYVTSMCLICFHLSDFCMLCPY